MIEIPLSSVPEQKFSCVIEGNKYEFRVIFNTRTRIWSMDISLGKELLVAGISLLGGVDILKQYTLPISRAYVVNLDNTDKDPELETLGISSKLFILTEGEVSGG